MLLRCRALVVLCDRVAHHFAGPVIVVTRDLGRLLTELTHDVVDVLQLLEARPASIDLAPGRSGCEPHGKGLGEVFVGMLLRVPAGDVAHKLAREWARFILFQVRKHHVAEQRAPSFGFVQLVCVVERVARLVAQIA
jgi:hypothetical protein